MQNQCIRRNVLSSFKLNTFTPLNKIQVSFFPEGTDNTQYIPVLYVVLLINHCLVAFSYDVFYFGCDLSSNEILYKFGVNCDKLQKLIYLVIALSVWNSSN